LTGLKRHYDDTRTVAADGIYLEQDSYDPLTRDSDQIVRILSFHESAGGKEYTTLTNHLLQALDFSAQVRTNRAVLFGRIAVKGSAFALDEENIEPSRHAAYVRILLPVERSRAERKALTGPVWIDSGKSEPEADR
jgi:hypothetical protein